jgi:opacity protein-like surface antigen
MTFKKNKISFGVALATITMASALVSPQAAAHKASKHKAVKHSSSSHSNAERMAAAANSKAEMLEAQLRAMQDEMASLRAQIGGAAPASAADAQKVQELDAWMASVKSEPAKAKHGEDNMIFFRGGFARNDDKRNDLLTGNQVAGGALGAGVTNQDGYYVGAGFDFGLTDDVWGLMKNTDVMAELMFDYRNFGQKNFNGLPNPLGVVVTGAGAALGIPGAAGTSNVNRVTVSQFTLAASPKIKFMKGSAFRPWVIPFGLTVNVISPPSNGVTVLNPGVQFGTGAEYAIWKAIKLGADVRYNLTGRSVDGVNTNGLTAGGYLGIGF